MNSIIRLFHYISFIKYPLLAVAVYFCYRPVLFDDSNYLGDTNTGLIFLGLGISLDSLKDYKKLTWLDKQVLHRPKLAKYYFALIAMIILGTIIVGAKGYFSAEKNNLKELSVGLIVLGIGAIGFLKSGIEATKSYIDQNK